MDQLAYLDRILAGMGYVPPERMPVTEADWSSLRAATAADEELPMEA